MLNIYASVTEFIINHWTDILVIWFGVLAVLGLFIVGCDTRATDTINRED